LQHAWECFPALQAAMPTAPREAARTMYYDNLVYDSATIAYLLQTFGPTRLMLGSDYPFAIMEPDPVGRLATLALDEPTRALLRDGNAARWLGLEGAA
jgi:aminocarboxymuconate-semialdehyde decarboxylase